MKKHFGINGLATSGSKFDFSCPILAIILRMVDLSRSVVRYYVNITTQSTGKILKE